MVQADRGRSIVVCPLHGKRTRPAASAPVPYRPGGNHANKTMAGRAPGADRLRAGGGCTGMRRLPVRMRPGERARRSMTVARGSLNAQGKAGACEDRKEQDGEQTFVHGLEERPGRSRAIPTVWEADGHGKVLRKVLLSSTLIGSEGWFHQVCYDPAMKISRSNSQRNRQRAAEPHKPGLAPIAVVALVALLATTARTLPAQALQSGPMRQAVPPLELQKDSSAIAPDGTAYVTRVVPVPKTVSPEAQKSLSRVVSDAAPPPETVEQARAGTDRWQAGAALAARKLYPAEVTAGTLAGVPVRIVTPPSIAPGKRDRVLLNLHGGGFRVDSGSLVESIPIASLTGIKVVSVLYRMAPEHPYPAALDDAVAVYRELLKTYKPAHIAIYGSSAGAILTAEVTARLKQLGLPLPGATGVFSGMGDLGLQGDSIALYGLNGFAGHLDPPRPGAGDLAGYVGSTDLRDPVLSPLYGDLHGFPPTLFVTSGRDLLLSGTTILHRAYLRAGVDARLVVFEALPHTFWNDFKLPESREALELMASFLTEHLSDPPRRR